MLRYKNDMSSAVDPAHILISSAFLRVPLECKTLVHNHYNKTATVLTGADDKFATVCVNFVSI